MVHFPNLDCFLCVVTLVDADCVYPEETARCCREHIPETLLQARRNHETVTVADYGGRSGCVPPGIGECTVIGRILVDEGTELDGYIGVKEVYFDNTEFIGTELGILVGLNAGDIHSSVSVGLKIGKEWTAPRYRVDVLQERWMLEKTLVQEES